MKPKLGRRLIEKKPLNLRLCLRLSKTDLRALKRARLPDEKLSTCARRMMRAGLTLLAG